MAVPESARKAVSLAIIAVLCCASAWLPQKRPSSSKATVPSRPLLVAVAAPPVVRYGVRPGSESITTPIRARSERGQSRLRVDSEREYGATQGLGTGEVAELRTASFPATLATAPAAISAYGAAAPDSEPADAVGRALTTAGRETRGALVTAGRSIRTAFTRVRF